MDVPYLDDPEKRATRDGYGEALVELGEQNKEVVVLSAGLANSLKVEWFKDKFPNRYFEVGIAEQDMVGIAAGLSLTGKIPFVSSFGVFAVCRAFDQLRVSVAFMNANVKIGGSHCGLHMGQDGATAQAIEDVALARVLPNIAVVVPCDYYETKKAVHKAADINGPVYIRFSRNKVPVITTFDTHFEIGKAEVFKQGRDVAIVACGHMVYSALLAARDLEKHGVDVRVINCHTIKPIDKQTILDAAKECKAIVTAEDHHIAGGLGSAVAEVVVKENPVPIKMIGVKDTFAESGKPEELMHKYGLTSGDIVNAVIDVVKEK